MATGFIPAQPELFKQWNGKYSIRFAGVRPNGAPCARSHPLGTLDEKEAGSLMRAFLKSEDYQRMKSQPKNGKANGHHHPVPVLIPEAPQKRPYRKRQHPGIAQAQAQLKMLAAQLQAIALNVQLLGETLGAAADDED